MIRADLNLTMDGEEVTFSIESALDLLNDEKRRVGTDLANRLALAAAAALADRPITP